jgi:hypothetical protein
MENQAFLRTLGCLDLPGLDGIPKGGMFLKNGTAAGAPPVHVTCGTGKYVCEGGPHFSFLDAFFDEGANASFYPYPPQSIDNAVRSGAFGNSVEMFSAEQLPIKAALAKSYGVFNKLYTASPTMSWPNHMFAQTGTSCGCTRTGPGYDEGGGPTKTYPQFTIYDSMDLDNVSFGLYGNVSCGEAPNASDPVCSNISHGGGVFDTYMAGVARHPTHFYSQTTFFNQAANGSLPAFSYLSPTWQACDHPCQDLAKGDRLLKDTYEALRAGPNWDKTLFLVAYDDIGGYFDHIIPPSKNVPAPNAPCNSVNNGFPSKFDFRRLGGRTTALLMGGRVPNKVFQEPEHGPQPSSEFDLASIASTVHRLFNLSTQLTERTMWSAPFDELLLDEPRPEAEMPMHLPTAPPASSPWSPPTTPKDLMSGDDDDDDDNDDDDDERRRLASAGGSRKMPQHCGSAEQSCRDPGLLSVKQERLIQHFAELTGRDPPDGFREMRPKAAEQWLAEHWALWESMGHPTV